MFRVRSRLFTNKKYKMAPSVLRIIVFTLYMSKSHFWCDFFVSLKINSTGQARDLQYFLIQAALDYKPHRKNFGKKLLIFFVHCPFLFFPLFCHFSVFKQNLIFNIFSPFGNSSSTLSNALVNPSESCCTKSSLFSIFFFTENRRNARVCQLGYVKLPQYFTTLKW